VIASERSLTSSDFGPAHSTTHHFSSFLRNFASQRSLFPFSFASSSFLRIFASQRSLNSYFFASSSPSAVHFFSLAPSKTTYLVRTSVVRTLSSLAAVAASVVVDSFGYLNLTLESNYKKKKVLVQHTKDNVN